MRSCYLLAPHKGPGGGGVALLDRNNDGTSVVVAIRDVMPVRYRRDERVIWQAEGCIRLGSKKV